MFLFRLHRKIKPAYRIKDVVMQIEKALINDRLLFQKYPENFASQLLIVLQ